jgi:SAM-dependent MidA family methyltransferase
LFLLLNRRFSMPDDETAGALRAGPNTPYPRQPKPATPGLSDWLRRTIAEAGPIGFDRYMAAALYHPEFGYYADPRRPIGRGGDFFTSVSVGPVFGRILARWALARHQALGRPDRWRLAEAGSHDGTLVRDLALELRRIDPAAAGGLVLTLTEPLAARRQRLEQATAGLPVAAVEVIDPASARRPAPLPGLVVANEVLDALPCRLVEFDGTHWNERVVDCDPAGGLLLRPQAIAEPGLRAAVKRLGDGLPAGYRTELRTGLESFLRPLRALLQRGRLLFFDYGFARAELLHPDRRQGTLRSYSGHRAGDDPLAAPGSCDLTAHVDFTAVAEAAAALDLQLAGFEPQERFLTREGRDWLLALEGLEPETRAAAVRQFRTLTHPALLGMKFHALELAWRVPVEPRAAAAASRRLE